MRTPVAILVYPGVQSLDAAGPFEVFRGADKAREADGSERCYEPMLVSADGGVVETESGLGLDSRPISDLGPGELHTLLVAGGEGSRQLDTDEEFVAMLASLIDRSARVLTVCTGAFPVAATGWSRGRRVATHWAHASRLASRYPGVEVEPDAIWLRDGPLWSSAGVTAGIDLALAVVEADHGSALAQTVARHLVMFLRRPGGQSQFAEPVTARIDDADRSLREVRRIVESDPAASHSVEALADEVGMSARHLTRRFVAATGLTPARYVAEVRIDAARRALEVGDDTVAVVADRCGFGTAETMRRTFLRHLGVSPDDYRRRFRLVPVSVRTPASATDSPLADSHLTDLHLTDSPMTDSRMTDSPMTEEHP